MQCNFLIRLLRALVLEEMPHIRVVQRVVRRQVEGPEVSAVKPLFLRFVLARPAHFVLRCCYCCYATLRLSFGGQLRPAELCSCAVTPYKCDENRF
jgi:hypothetical protein